MGKAAKRQRECLLCRNYCSTVAYETENIVKYVFYCETCMRKTTIIVEPLSPLL